MLAKIHKPNLLMGIMLFLSLFFLSTSPAFATEKTITTSSQYDHQSTLTYAQKVQMNLEKATANVPATQRNKMLKAIPMGNCGNALVIIWYNYGSNLFCVDSYGYNGLANTNGLSHVTRIGFPGLTCVNSGSWLKAYNASGFFAYFNGTVGIYSGPQPPYNYMTQIDVHQGC